jgi:hypothetical protein
MPNGGEVISTLVDLIKKDQRARNHFDDMKNSLRWDPVIRRADQELIDNAARKKIIEDEKNDQKSKLMAKHGVMAGVVLDFVSKGLLEVKGNKKVLEGCWYSTISEGDKVRKWQTMGKIVEAFNTEPGLIKEIEDQLKVVDE